MTHARQARRGRSGLVVLGIIALLAAFRPWTVVPIGTTAVREFNARRYVDDVWTTRVLPEAKRTAVPLAAALAGVPQVPGASPGGAARRSVFVTGTATVTSVDRQSRVGLARLDVPAAGKTPVALQIGPVIRGTVLRDAIGFMQFSDFDNQLQFAEVSSALNDQVLRTVIAAIDLETLAGQSITFTGAVAMGGDALEIVPVTMAITGGARGRR